MVKTRETDGMCETYSTENKKLLQYETGAIYGHYCFDVLEGYDDDGNPYCRFTYIETNIDDDPPEPEPDSGTPDGGEPELKDDIDSENAVETDNIE